MNQVLQEAALGEQIQKTLIGNININKNLSKMKTKSLLTAGSLALMLAACSNETELLTNTTTELGRASAGNVVITPAFGDADSRATWTGAGWVFNEEGDRFGAMLMDTWNQTNEGHTTIKDYTFVDYVHTNYPFHSNDGGLHWSAPENSQLSEGNYFFLYPYDETYRERGHVYFEIPNVQSNVNEETGKVEAIMAVKKYQEYLGYAFIGASDDLNNVGVNFHPLFANPKFKIQNLAGAPVRLIKLLVRTHQEGKAGAPKLMPNKLQLAPKSANFAAVNKPYAAGELTGAEETAVLFSHATKVLNGFYGSDNTKGVYEYVIDCGDNYIVPAGEFYKVSAIMPAGEYWDFDVYAFVEIQNSEKTTGIVSLNSVKTPTWSGMDIQNGSAQTVLKPGITQVLSASFDANAIANLGVQDFTVVTSEDMAFVIDLKAKDGGKDLVIIKTLGENVVLNSEIYNLISNVNRKGIKWQIDGTIVIPEGVPADAIDQLTTGTGGVKTTIINKGTQTLTKNLVNCDVVNYGTLTGDVTINGNVTNAEGAELTINTVYGNVDNKGTVTIELVTGVVNNGKYEAERKNSAIAPVTTANATIVTVNGTVRNWASMKLNNIKAGNSWSNKPGATLELLGSEEQFADSGENHEGATLVISGDYTDFPFLENTGVVNVNANVNMTLTASNAGEINIAENATLKATGNQETGLENKVLNYGIINVEGKLIDNIYNAGFINVKKNGLVIVKGCVEEPDYLEPHDNGVIITYQGGVGTIDVTEANATTTAQAAKANCEHMIFAYTVGSEKTDTALLAALKARISSANYGINPITLTWASTSATEFAGKLDEANVTNVMVDNNLTINGGTRFEDVVNNGFVVSPAATLTIANDITLRVADKVTVIINGTLKANNHSWLKGEGVTVAGYGSVYVESANCNWTKATGSWRGSWSE